MPVDHINSIADQPRPESRNVGSILRLNISIAQCAEMLALVIVLIIRSSEPSRARED